MLELAWLNGCVMPNGLPRDGPGLERCKTELHILRKGQ